MSIETPLLAAATRAIDYRKRLAIAERTPTRDYADRLAVFDAALPDQGSDGGDVIDALADLAEPGLRPTAGPRFFGWVIGASHPVGVAADWLTAAWGQNAGNHTAAPSAAAAETVAARWLLELLDLPRESSIGFVTGATVANFVCLAAARGEVLRRAGWDVEARGLFGAPEIDVVIGDDAHSTVFSALQFLGLGHDRVRRVRTDDQGRIDPAHFAGVVGGGTGPCIAVLQCGQLNTGACDPMDTLVAAARARGAWIHVDGAFGLWARAASRERARMTTGVDGADSWATDGHKWLQVPYDCGYAIVRDAQAHARAMTIAASYLPSEAKGERDPSHFVPELSRRARGFATWAMIRHLGREGIAAMVERHCAMARRIAEALAAEPGVQVLNEVMLNQIILRFGADKDGDAPTEAVIRRLQDDAVIFAGGARWRGRWVLRLSVISWGLDETQADISVAAISNAWRAIRRQGG